MLGQDGERRRWARGSRCQGMKGSLGPADEAANRNLCSQREHAPILWVHGEGRGESPAPDLGQGSGNLCGLGWAPWGGVQVS